MSNGVKKDLLKDFIGAINAIKLVTENQLPYLLKDRS